jgi:aldehyde dehydrogenase (NAD+)
MGSKSAVVVFSDADFTLSIDAALSSAFKLSGQRCVSAGRILVQSEIYHTFAAEFARRAGDLTVGPPDELADYGPLINEWSKQKVERYNQLVRDWNLEDIILETKEVDEGGYYLTPFVYKALWGDKPYLKDEVFGPHVAIVPFSDVNNAVEIVNDVEYGLGLGVCTNDYRVMRQMRDECNYGMLYINGGSIAAESHVPFGGVLRSGNGWKTAAGQHLSVTDQVSVTVNYGDLKWCQGMK